MQLFNGRDERDERDEKDEKDKFHFLGLSLKLKCKDFSHRP
jgi:hypothetical protein